MFVNSPTDGTDAFGQLSLSMELVGEVYDSFLSKGYVHGYSTHRKLTSNATLSYRARRETDNATQDIGFDGSSVDVSALAIFAGSTDARIEIFYDQVNSSGDATSDLPSSPDQFRLINSGTTEKLNSTIPCLTTVSTVQRIMNLASSDSFNDLTIFFVFETNNPLSGIIYPVNNGFTDYVNVSLPGSESLALFTGASVARYFFSPLLTVDTAYSICVVRSGADVNFWVDNVAAVGSFTVTEGTFLLPSLLRTTGSGIKLTEIHVFDNALSETDRDSFNVNLNLAHGI